MRSYFVRSVLAAALLLGASLPAAAENKGGKGGFESESPAGGAGTVANGANGGAGGSHFFASGSSFFDDGADGGAGRNAAGEAIPGGNGGAVGGDSTNGAAGGAGQTGASLGLSTLNNSSVIAGSGGGGGGSGEGGGAGGAAGDGIVGSGNTITNTANGQIGGGGGGGSGASSNNNAATKGAGGLGGTAIAGNNNTITNAGKIGGGGGGGGGALVSGFCCAGNAGAGGAGISGDGLTISNSGTIAGGNGGETSQGGTSGAGAAGITGSGLTITNSGTISGGTGGGGPIGGTAGANGNAILFTGGTNTLTLSAGSAITGTVGGSGTNTLQLGGTTAASFDISKVGTAAQYRNFGSYKKIDSSTWTLTGTNNATAMGWTVSAGTLNVTGSMSSSTVSVASGGTLSGNGTTGGVTVMNGGTIYPANNFGTLTVAGSLIFQAGATYKVDANGTGQANKIVVTGGAATLAGTVSVQASGNFAANQTYTILTGNGGVSGTFSNVTSNFAFLTPSLSYAGNNVMLTLAVAQNAFAEGAQNTNQRAVGTVLDNIYGSATGDMATVLNALAVLNQAQGAQALTVIGGGAYSALGSAALAGGNAAMNTIAGQTGPGGPSSAGTRVALVASAEEVCGIETSTCDAPAASGYSAWLAPLGNIGSIAGNATTGASAVNWNMAGIAVGADYRIDPHFLAGAALVYGNGQQWSAASPGQSSTESYTFALYGSFTEGPFYAQALAGYGYLDQRMTRVLAIPGLNTRIAQGNTHANQLMGQLEAGHRIDLLAEQSLALVPFVRLQGQSVSQAGFSETGAGSLSLNVAAQTTNSIRSTLGVNLMGDLPVGGDRKLAFDLRLGWLHDYADMTRPVNASFAGAPGQGFTVFGTAPERDGAAVGLAVGTKLDERTLLSLGYTGELANGAQNHTGSLTLRMIW